MTIYEKLRTAFGIIAVFLWTFYIYKRTTLLIVLGSIFLVITFLMNLLVAKDREKNSRRY